MRGVLISEHFEEILCAGLLLIMVGITTLNILSRPFPGFSFAFSEEIVVNLFVWLIMLGSVVGVKQRSHIAITFLVRKIPSQFQRIFFVIQYICVFCTFFLLLVYGTIETWSEYRCHMMTYSLGWPIWIFTLALPVGSLLFIIRFSQVSLIEWKTFK